jgi:hypothetical protein
MKNFTVTVGASVCGFCAGLFLASGGNNTNFVKTFSLAGLMSLPTVFVAHLIVDSQATQKINKAEEQIELATAQTLHVKTLLSGIELKNGQLVEELATLRQTLESVESDRAKSTTTASALQHMVAELQQRLEAAGERVEDLEAEVNEWETQFDSRVAVEAEARLTQARNREIQMITSEHRAISQEAMQLYEALRQWGLKIAHGHSTKRELIVNLVSAYNNNLDDLNNSVDKERDQYLQQIEALRERVGLLQHELAGDLVEPQYLECGFDESGRIADALANWLWVNRKIPLKVTGFEQHADGSVTVGYSYSRSVAPESLIKVIEGDSTTIARNLGLYAIEKPQKLQVTDCLVVKVRRDRPARKADKGSLYRSKEEFVKFILGQPVRLRVIGEPGAGKTPTVAVLLDNIINRGFLSANTPNGQKLPYCVVESCNPLAGISVKNGDELEFCLKWNSGAKGFKGLVEEYRFRKNPVNAEYTNQVGYIWVADEIDNTMADLTKDEAKPFKDALKDGGHVNIGVIVMGQSANISTSKGLSIDDQKMMTNIYIDAVSIRTFLTQYGERFYSKKAVEKALSTLEELELEIEEQNEIICDTAREFRIAMVTANRSPVFYQLPYFDSVDIDVEAYQQILDKVSGIRSGLGETPTDASVSTHPQDAMIASASERRDVSGRLPYAGSETGRDVLDKPTCPYCGSSDIRSKGNSWLCQNLEHSNQAPGKPKSWKK